VLILKILYLMGTVVSRNVQVDLQTHVIGGVSEVDMNMASELDEIEVDYSPKWLKEYEAKGVSQ